MHTSDEILARFDQWSREREALSQAEAEGAGGAVDWSSSDDEGICLAHDLAEEVRRSHAHRRIPGGFVACSCGAEWSDHRKHVEEKVAEAERGCACAVLSPEGRCRACGREWKPVGKPRTGAGV